MKSIVLQIFNDALKSAQPSNLLSKSLSLDNNKINVLSDQMLVDQLVSKGTERIKSYTWSKAACIVEKILMEF